ncbi:MAG: aspartate/glutamate racemase family protein [Bifidobacteriaceae bacterium]|jgi:glutamate racemase|nr:aspartate/glutamate racemase family protein [Bifidobacteriaceae bacterium]
MIPGAVGLIHTVPALAGDLDRLLGAALPDARRIHIADPWLLDEAQADGLTSRIVGQVAAHVNHLARLGCRAVLLTCSSIGPAAAPAARATGLPVFRIDAPMAERAVDLAAQPGAAGRIAVLATLPSTVAPTTDLIREVAAGRGAAVEVAAQVVGGAQAARQAGRPDQADRLVAAAITAATPTADAVVLAQASMAGAAATVDVPKPVLTSQVSGIGGFAKLAAAALAGRP